MQGPEGRDGRERPFVNASDLLEVMSTHSAAFKFATSSRFVLRSSLPLENSKLGVFFIAVKVVVPFSFPFSDLVILPSSDGDGGVDPRGVRWLIGRFGPLRRAWSTARPVKAHQAKHQLQHAPA